ncbi:MAG: secondary thiamine-phosphate synthase enzyme YjbQ [Armatimonadota bacterium]|nr:secondary thiamine-phosphate synthase enzyme YjbQ [Armatimonadota bacterium]MDR7450305.1 secondary thiamine-phosphate synthase enzyme YjbQ [Armatimonadota bacterium]MDR7467112.1 secondary thiamine-phosphate synthase enzyme YjbQ [Armatimonadota bacterium]MDR7493346.1 secondary thiamine-phosphate synthase enzyme YjbQ [Armatimonadota bacterium]MDR7499354.1 secondary thiamine-phosphate synthase enzyme YjbQ [Armatimonadota bacterium]
MRWHLLDLSSTRRVQIIDVTESLRRICRESGVREGLAVVVCEHTTAGVCVNEAEPNLLTDLQRALERLIPEEGDYRHNRLDDNTDAHLRAVLIGHSVTLPIQDGVPVLGTWQRVLFVELDGPRRRRLRVGVGG